MAILLEEYIHVRGAINVKFNRAQIVGWQRNICGRVSQRDTTGKYNLYFITVTYFCISNIQLRDLSKSDKVNILSSSPDDNGH